MSSRSKTISRLLEDQSAREAYLRAKLDQLIPSQIRALRLREEWTQKQLGDGADMKQARVSAIEKPGEVNFSLETLIRLAAVFQVGLQVRFIPFSQMLDWENDFSQDTFAPTRINNDERFLRPMPNRSKNGALAATPTRRGELIPVALTRNYGRPKYQRIKRTPRGSPIPQSSKEFIRSPHEENAREMYAGR